ncbi:hypothetical protein ZWY2020_002961 [Hordeum vulgare]|nr:hypothetical protein ZWY2020_002961 [Hordeum vulgare]
MKCHSVAALWSPSPPSHHITAVAATPAALFTGAADGTVLYWPLPPSPPFCPRPSSLLCAHAAAITALCPLPSPASLLVSCTAGVLSLFSASAPLRCLRRRSLPPWAGSPSLVALLPTTSSSTASSNPRVAILCHPHDDGHAHRHVSALVVVDARTLAVLHTAFHGALSVAPPRAIALTVCSDDNAVSVVLADAHGRAQMVPVAEGAAIQGDSPRRLSVSSLSSFASAEAPDGSVEAVALSDDGKVVALVLKTSCLLKCVVEGSVLGEVSLANTSLCKEEETGVKGCLAGVFFLHGGECGGPRSEDGTVVRSLVLWSSNGGAMVYKVAVGTPPLFGFEAVCEVPVTGSILGGTTSASSLLVPILKGTSTLQSHANRNGLNISSIPMNHHNAAHSIALSASAAHDVKGKTPAPVDRDNSAYNSGKSGSAQITNKRKKYPIKCSCPYPGIASLRFDLTVIMSAQGMSNGNSDRQLRDHLYGDANKETMPPGALDSISGIQEMDSPSRESLEGQLLRFSLCFLHLWDVDCELDKLLVDEMQVCKPEGCHIASGVVGDRGSFTVMFPGKEATLELWKSSAEFCAMRSLSIVSLAQRMITLSRSCTNASSALAAFYTRHFAEKVPDIKPPSLQLLVSFWQHPSEHVRMAARSLFHCSAPRSVPQPLRVQRNKIPDHLSLSDYMDKLIPEMQRDSVSSYGQLKADGENLDRDDDDVEDTSQISLWLESFENQEWLSWIGGTSQDAVASNIIVAAAFVVWYPSIVKVKLAKLVVNQLIKLVMSMNDRYSSTAAELLAEGMESTWKTCLGTEITHFLSDVLFQIECLSSAPSSNAIYKTAVAVTMREALIGTLLPSLAMADIMGFFGVIESQIWATSSDSPVHVVSLKTLIRVLRGSPKALAPYLDKAISYILHTMDPSNLIMRKACIISSMMALREIARVFPMVALNESMTRLAVGDAIGEIHSATIRVYDIESVTKIRILDACGPPGLPSFLKGPSDTTTTILITALSFSPDGEGLVAFSENGLMIRWWSLGSAWWERLSRSLTPIQCTKLIYVPPWEGFSPNSARLSIISSILGHDKHKNSESKTRELDEADNLKLLLHNLDLSYRLHWVGGKTIKLTRHDQDLVKRSHQVQLYIITNRIVDYNITWRSLEGAILFHHQATNAACFLIDRSSSGNLSIIRGNCQELGASLR